MSVHKPLEGIKNAAPSAKHPIPIFPPHPHCPLFRSPYCFSNAVTTTPKAAEGRFSGLSTEVAAGSLALTVAMAA